MWTTKNQKIKALREQVDSLQKSVESERKRRLESELASAKKGYFVESTYDVKTDAEVFSLVNYTPYISGSHDYQHINRGSYPLYTGSKTECNKRLKKLLALKDEETV